MSKNFLIHLTHLQQGIHHRSLSVRREHRSSDKSFETNSKAALPRLEHLSASSTTHVLNETVDNSTGQCTHNAYSTCNDHAEHVPHRDKSTDRSTDRPQSHRRPSPVLDRCDHRTDSSRRGRDGPCGRSGARGELLLSSLFPRGALPARMLASRGTCRAHGCSYTEAAYELQAVLWTAAGRATGKQGQLAVGLGWRSGCA